MQSVQESEGKVLSSLLHARALWSVALHMGLLHSPPSLGQPWDTVLTLLLLSDTKHIKPRSKPPTLILFGFLSELCPHEASKDFQMICSSLLPIPPSSYKPILIYFILCNSSFPPLPKCPSCPCLGHLLPIPLQDHPLSTTQGKVPADPLPPHTLSSLQHSLLFVISI